MNSRTNGFCTAVRNLAAAAVSSACVMAMVQAEGNSGWQKWPYEMNKPRSQFTMTKLSGDKLLIAGGYDGNTGTVYMSTEIIDITTGKSIETVKMNHVRAAHTESLLDSEKVLVVGGYYYDSSSGSTDPLYVSKPEIFNGTNWEYAGDLGKGFTGHTATVLKNGKVLIAGGYNKDDGFYAKTHIYDPEKGQWSNAASMGTARSGHTATLLNDGKVLVAGGYNSNDGYLASSEIYDPTSDNWEKTEQMFGAVAYHASVFLPDTGKALLIGGSNAPGTPVKLVQLYDPVTRLWGRLDDMEFARMHPAAVCLSGEEVIVGGGMTGPNSFDNHIERYNVAEDTWTTVGTLRNSRANFAMEYLGDNKVIFTGGRSADSFGFSKYLSKSEIYDTSTKETKAPGLLNQARFQHVAVLLDDDSIFAAGGKYYKDGKPDTLDSIEICPRVLDEGEWKILSSKLGSYVYSASAIRLNNGKILVIGGRDNLGGKQDCYIYDPVSGEVSATGSLKFGASSCSVAMMNDGKVICAGGTDDHNAMATTQIYDPATGQWSEAENMKQARIGANIATLNDGKIIVVGGMNSEGAPLSSAEIFDPSTGKWSDASNMNKARKNFAFVDLDKGKKLAMGGKIYRYSSSANEQKTGYEDEDNSCEIYDPETNAWTEVTPMNESRQYHTASVLKDGRVLVAGGNDGNKPLSSSEIYDPVNDTWELIGNMTCARQQHVAVSTSDGKVVLIGGYDGDAMDSVELFDPGSAPPPVTDGTIEKLAFSASHKEFLKKENDEYIKHSTNKFTISGTISFGQDFNPDDIKEGETFSLNFGNYSFSGTFGNAADKSKTFTSKPGKGGTAKFANKATDQFKAKNVLVEKIDIKWDAKGKFTFKVSGTPVTDSTTSPIDGKTIPGNIEIFQIGAGSKHGAAFGVGEKLGFTGKKTPKTSKGIQLESWTAKGAQ